jgi:hypothetical protein
MPNPPKTRTSNTGLTHAPYSHSVVLPYISERFVEQILILDLVFHVDHFAQSLLHLALTGLGVLPAGKPNHPHDLINIGHDRSTTIGVLPFYFSEQFGEGSFGFILLVDRINLLFGGWTTSLARVSNSLRNRDYEVGPVRGVL